MGRSGSFLQRCRSFFGLRFLSFAWLPTAQKHHRKHENGLQYRFCLHSDSSLHCDSQGDITSFGSKMRCNGAKPSKAQAFGAAFFSERKILSKTATLRATWGAVHRFHLAQSDKRDTARLTVAQSIVYGQQARSASFRVVRLAVHRFRFEQARSLSFLEMGQKSES